MWPHVFGTRACSVYSCVLYHFVHAAPQWEGPYVTTGHACAGWGLDIIQLGFEFRVT